jgi:glycerophosphoryl diester phosphodiesterase
MKNIIVYLLILFIGFQCSNKIEKIDLQGHRGCRGIMPENTIPAFIEALEIGVTTLEMDVCITKDLKVVVSHEPFMSHEICTKPDGSPIIKDEEMSYNIYEMAYDSLSTYDCGLKDHPRFPKQRKMGVFKPLLTVAIDSVEAYIKRKGILKVNYNIEIKSNYNWDNRYHPEPGVFAELVLKDIKRVEERTTIQSFDKRPIQYIHNKYPEITKAILVEFESDPKKVIESLGFVPEIYSPYFNLIDDNLISFCRNNNMKLVPWTINEKSDVLKVLEYGVDGIITDYPKKIKEILSARAH